MCCWKQCQDGGWVSSQATWKAYEWASNERPEYIRRACQGVSSSSLNRYLPASAKQLGVQCARPGCRAAKDSPGQLPSGIPTR